jgi:hypothetical protein
MVADLRRALKAVKPGALVNAAVAPDRAEAATRRFRNGERGWTAT